GAPTAQADITGKSVTVAGTFTANNKTYDGTVAATINDNSLTLDGVVDGDDVSINVVTLAFSDKDVADGKTVTITNLTLSGDDAENYSVNVSGSPTTTANITPIELTLAGTFTANNKTYDGNTTATFDDNSLSLTGVLGGETVTLDDVDLSFDTKN